MVRAPGGLVHCVPDFAGARVLRNGSSPRRRKNSRNRAASLRSAQTFSTLDSRDMEPARKLATYADLLALGEDVRAEVIHGSLDFAPAPLPRHSNARGSARRFLGGPFHDDDGFDGPGGWWIFVEVDVRLAAHQILRPDLAGWQRERLKQPDVRPIDIVPDWTCEILSPSSRARDRVTKRMLYAEYGVSHYWLIDPEALTLDAQKRWVEAVELPVGRLFLPRGQDAPDLE